jgi:hypothetical protein
VSLAHGGPFCATFGSETSPSIEGTRLLIELATTHFLLDSTSLDKLAKPSYGFLNALPVPNHQFDHACSPNRLTELSCKKAPSLGRFRHTVQPA